MQVTLEVFTLDWVKLQTIADRNCLPGLYGVTFDAKDLPSGDYYYVLSGNNYKIVKVMTLMK